MEDIKAWLASYAKLEKEAREYEQIISKERGRYAGLLEAMAKYRDGLHEQQRQIRRAIDGIQDPSQRAVLRGVFIDGKTAQQMAAAIGYSEPHTYRILRRGIKTLEDAQRGPETPQDEREAKAGKQQGNKRKRPQRKGDPSKK